LGKTFEDREAVIGNENIKTDLNPIEICGKIIEPFGNGGMARRISGANLAGNVAKLIKEKEY